MILGAFAADWANTWCMNNRYTLPGAALPGAVLLLIGCVSPEVQRISVAELYQALTDNTAVCVDVRSKHEFDTSHIKGSVSIPLSQVEQRSDELPGEKLIVTYCA